eukprot:scaffold81404_cov65-Phaeocystis_antarctica.AAC.2
MLFLINAYAVVLGVCSGMGYEMAVENLRQKLGNPSGEPQAGADYYKGAGAAAIYIYTHNEDYGSTAKVCVHEYHHLLQQGMLHGSITSTTAPGGVVGFNDMERFQTKDYGGIGGLWTTHVKGVMDGLPASIKLFDLPTYVLVIAEGVGGIGDEDDDDGDVVTTAIEDLVPLLWPNDCAGVDFENRLDTLVNGALAEGEAEYYAANVYMNSGGNTYNDDSDNNLNWDGGADWMSRVANNEEFMNGTPGKELYHLPLTFPVENAFKKLEELGWRQHPVGQICYTHLKNVWRPATTQAELMQVNIVAYAENSFEVGFETVFNSSWREFVCHLETHHQISRAAQTCLKSTKEPPKREDCTLEIVLGVLGRLAFGALAGLVSLAMYCGACACGIPNMFSAKHAKAETYPLVLYSPAC